MKKIISILFLLTIGYLRADTTIVALNNVHHYFGAGTNNRTVFETVRYFQTLFSMLMNSKTSFIHNFTQQRIFQGWPGMVNSKFCTTFDQKFFTTKYHEKSTFRKLNTTSLKTAIFINF